MIECGKILKGKYKITALIGEGAQGRVYKGEDTEGSKQKYAIKEFIRASTSLEVLKSFTYQYTQEERILKQLDDPRLPRMFDAFTFEGKRYIVMEFIEGENLETILKNSPAPLPEVTVLKWAIQIAEILQYLHSRKPAPVIYRDMKPSNILISPGEEVKLVDFGIARKYDITKTTDTLRFGTPGYAAPEQYKGKGQTSPGSDIYALGVILHELLTKYDPSVTPFKRPDIKSQNPGVSKKTIQIINKATQLKPEARYLSVLQLKEELLLSLLILTDEKKGNKTKKTSLEEIEYKPDSFNYAEIANFVGNPLKVFPTTFIILTLLILLLTGSFTWSPIVAFVGSLFITLMLGKSWKI